MIMKEVPTPVLLVSSITTEGAAITLEALNLGAVDYIPKSQSFVAIDITKIKDELIAKVKNICRSTRYTSLRQRLEIRSRREKYAEQPKTHEVPYNLHNTFFNCIAIGVSTGGPPVIQRILSSLPGNFPLPILIAQHMPLEFTRTFADRLNNLSAINVKEAATGDVLQKGWAYIGQEACTWSLNVKVSKSLLNLRVILKSIFIIRMPTYCFRQWLTPMVQVFWV
jgi:two-component system chemotaxis response regulator CheB